MFEKEDTERLVRLFAKAPAISGEDGTWSRRDIARMFMGAVATTAALGYSTRPSEAFVRTQTPGLKLTQNTKLDADADQMLFLKQCGYSHVFSGSQKMMSVEELKAAKKHFSDAGLTLHNIRYKYSNMYQILLNLPDRDAALADQIQWIKNSGAAGFDYTGSTLEAAGVLRKGAAITRGAKSTGFDWNSPDLRGYNKKAGKGDLAYGRVYTRDEMLGNFSKYYVGQVVPALEQAGVFVGFHPDDAPVYDDFAGVPRIFGTMDKVKHIFDLAHDSPNVGIMMCCGTWNEGGDKMGMKVTDALRYLWGRKKFREIHFRNISSPIPKFHETFMDNGYYDMYQIMKTLVDMDYNHNVNLDHVPAMVGGLNSYVAWAAGYMKACYERAMIDSGKKWPTEKS